MSEAAQERFDRVAVQEFCDALAEQQGVVAAVISHPEDDPASPLTVDALVSVDGAVWAADHMRLVYERDLIPAVDDVAERLRAELEKLAVEYDRYFVVTYVPPGLAKEREGGRAGRRARTVERDAFVDRVVALGRQAVTTGNDRFLHDGYTTVRFALRPMPDGQRVQLMAWGSNGPWLEAQVHAGLAEPLRGKVSGQLARAKAAGYPVMLIIDQVQDPDSDQPSQFLATAGTVRPLVEAVLQETPGIVDTVWFRDRNKRLHKLV